MRNRNGLSPLEAEVRLHHRNRVPHQYIEAPRTPQTARTHRTCSASIKRRRTNVRAAAVSTRTTAEPVSANCVARRTMPLPWSSNKKSKSTMITIGASDTNGSCEKRRYCLSQSLSVSIPSPRKPTAKIVPPTNCNKTPASVYTAPVREPRPRATSTLTRSAPNHTCAHCGEPRSLVLRTLNGAILGTTT